MVNLNPLTDDTVGVPLRVPAFCYTTKAKTSGDVPWRLLGPDWFNYLPSEKNEVRLSVNQSIIVIEPSGLEPLGIHHVDGEREMSSELNNEFVHLQGISNSFNHHIIPYCNYRLTHLKS
jgi:hypothetical protein